MVSAFVPGASGPGSSPGRGHVDILNISGFIVNAKGDNRTCCSVTI